jgi:ATP-dependent helicase/nuclease subunit A
LLERIVRDRRVMTLAFAAPRARDVWRRIRFLVDQARLFEASQSADLVEFVAWSELQRSDAARVHEPLLPESDDHAVRIMTMHGSKGLEFPITVLSGLTTEIGRRRPGVRVFWDGDDVFVSMRKDVASEGFDRRADLEEEMDRDEKLRLLYVACTRARDHLLVAAHHKSDAKADCFARLLWNATADATEGTWEAVDVPEDRLPAASGRDRPVVAPAPRADVEATEAAWRQDRDTVLQKAARRGTVSATAVKHAGTPGDPWARVAVVDLADNADEADAGIAAPPVPAWRRGRGATAFGRAVHAVLQDVDLATGTDVDALASAAGVAEGVPAQVGEIATAARAILGAPIMHEAAGASVAREMYVAAPIGDRVVEGYIDLLVRTPDGLVVVDYKTDYVEGDAAIDARADDYALQLAAYALAVEVATGEPVRTGVLLFGAVPGAPGAVERRLTRAELDTDRVAAMLAQPG